MFTRWLAMPAGTLKGKTMSKLTDKIEAAMYVAYGRHEKFNDYLRAILADARALEDERDNAYESIRQAKREAYEHALAMAKTNVSMVNHLTAAIAALDTEEG